MPTELTVAGKVITYFTADDVVPPDSGARFDRLVDARLAKHPRLRRFLVRLRPGWPAFYYVLHWSNGMDLAALDGRVIAGTVTEEEFSGALVGEFLDHVCMECGAHFEVVALEGGVLFTADRQKRISEHTFVESCPFCGASLRRLVLEILT
ncbi:hypothetical protein [Krasilnikovia sp. MM14-A1259]|uniref:hypothetical protein n=1 Tax=Krasilnikovia sp. MM14-A1259 TaxID=3373539 RepID=UPI00380B6F03